MRIWYDYTTTIRNTGRSGIANVEWSVGRALRSQRPNARTFALTPRGGLVVIDPDVALADAEYARPEVGVTVGSPAPAGRVTAVRSVVIDVLEAKAPWAIRPIVLTLKVPRRVRSFLRSARPQRRLDGEPLRPCVERGDVVVSMGAVWSGELADELADLRAATGCRVITMVYDLVPLTHPHLAFHNDPAFFAEYYLRLLRCSDLITCISEQSRRDLLEFAAARMVPAPPVEVLRLGEDDPGPPVGDRRQDFFLWVGTVERRKNLELLYDALRILESEGAELPKIVVAGAPGWGVDDLVTELAHGSTVASRAVILLGAVDEDVLYRLYRRARALLFPSHYEGWGLPVREAAIRGCPVVVGDSPAVREATAGLPGATVLPVDDPGPWAEVLRLPPPVLEPADRYPWSSTAAVLGALADDLARSGEVPNERR